jgi:DNA-binding NtrC family response regulator
MVGESKALEAIREMIDKVAPSDARVLITGGNGAGKEGVARMLHDKSSRVQGPFIEVNCAAIPGELIESELFGHVKGSFTSASTGAVTAAPVPRTVVRDRAVVVVRPTCVVASRP